MEKALRAPFRKPVLAGTRVMRADPAILDGAQPLERHSRVFSALLEDLHIGFLALLREP
jgi:hypothetical protein